ncbi:MULTISPECIES: hypothetical protein [unclassified Streptomyces]|uniref:hypothetical protein n=1 Tax=Streptomyces TaxID=1883 RepID=UPI0001C19E5D|nr:MULTISPECIES: hypothetical protein [unclassified Streptomyces]MYR68854.1 hypothetical protein [Streptomyces sp. SID4939]MYS02878.1 hypothetical protein [Streptomyces sp. SID4940]MYT62235.1 hypothetical protein [Streptomyces sp. SID8357]MYT83969.1 hypothetical protein [Streptomyces sp. SID8360]MYW38048.1 hypothetical protein [Streptomyces sp. SID1]
MPKNNSTAMRALVVAGATALSTLALGVSGASASSHTCTYDNACLYENAELEGMYLDSNSSLAMWSLSRYAGQPDTYGKSPYMGDGVKTNASSLDNWDIDSVIGVFYNSSYRGPCFTVGAYKRAMNFKSVTLSSGGGVANDRMNSHQFNNAC